MRRRNKVLAFVLAILMVVGMLPLSVFAAAGDSNSNSSSTQPQTREEWVTAQGGTMLFGSSFDNPEKYDPNYKDTSGNYGKVSSEDGMGTGYMSRVNNAPGGAKVTVENGAVHVTSGATTGDVWPGLNLSTTSGGTVVFEFSIKFNKPWETYDAANPTKNSAFLYFVDDSSLTGNSTNGRRINMYPLSYQPIENAEDGTPRGRIILGTNTNIVLAEFKVGEEVSVAFTYDTASKRVTGYDGEGNYVGACTIYQNQYDYYDDPEYASYQKADYPSVNGWRWLQVSSRTNMDAELCDLYVYEGVSQPYSSEYSNTGAGALNGLMKFLRTNNAKYLAYFDFEDAITYGRTSTVDEETGLKVYDLNNETGQSFNLSTPGMSNSFLNARKAPSTHTIRGEVKDGDLNQFLRIETTGSGTDTYIDLLTTKGSKTMTKFAEGDKVVIQASLRKSYASDNFTFNLFSFKNRSYYYTYEQIAGADTADTSDDKYVRKGTQNNGTWTYDSKNNDIGMLSLDTEGNINYGSENLGKLKLKVNAFTDVAVIIDSASNKFSIAIDGVIVKSDITLLTNDKIANYTNEYKFVKSTEKHTDGRDIYTKDESRVWNTGMYYPYEVRIGANGGKGVNGYIDVDNLFAYAGTSISATNFYVSNNIVGEPNTWEQNAEGYWRYYGADGKPVTGKQTIDGKTYYFTDDGYFATVERDYLFEFNSAHNDGYVTASANLAASTDVHFDWKYSALWKNIYYDGAPGDESIKHDFNGDGDTSDSGESISNPYGYGSTSVTLAASSAAVNSKFKRNLTAEEITAYGLDSTKTYPVFDFADYAGLEIDWFTDKAVDMHMKSIWYAHKEDASVNGAKYGKFDKTLYNTASGTNGWHSTILDLTNSFAPMDGAQNEIQNFRLGTVANFQLKTTWDNSNANNFLDNVKIYIARISLVKYVPAKLDVSPATLTTIRKVEGKTVLYAENMSVPSKGWVSIGTDKYFCTPDGVAQTGTLKIGEVIYEFDDNGKLVGNADGLYTINGKNYYYENGTCKIGNYTITVDGKQITVNTKGDGEIEDMRGVIPGFTVGSSQDLDYDTLLAGKKVILKHTFDTLPIEEPEYVAPKFEDGKIVYTQYNGNVPYFTGAMGTEGVDRIGSFTWTLKMTRFFSALDSVRADSTNDVALRMYNEGIHTDPYIDLNIAENLVAVDKPLKNVVAEASVKIGEDWSADATLFNVMDRSPNTAGAQDRNQYAGGAIYINKNGYVYVGDTILCKLSTTEYTRISVVHLDSVGNNGALDIYVNGVKVYTHTITNSAFDAPTKFRFAQYIRDTGYGSLYVDDIYIYDGTEPVAVDTTSQVRNGIVTENGVTRYFVNGVAKTGAVTVDNGEYHEIYNFNNTNATGLEGFYSDGYYYVGGKAANYEGVKNIDGVDYYFGADHKVIKNGDFICHLDPSKSYKTDANGAIIYRGIIDDKTTADAGEMANNVNTFGEIYNNGSVYYDAELGTNVLKYTSRDNQFTLFRVENGLDLNDYEYITFKVYVNDALKNANYGLVVGSDCTYSKVSGFDPEKLTHQSVDASTKVYSVSGYARLKDSNGNNTNYYAKSNNGVLDYNDVYLRYWDYAGPGINNFGGQTGWVEITLPLSPYKDKFSVAENIALVTTGWEMNASISKSQTLVIAEATLIAYAEPNETLNGWVDGKYYENGYFKTGWFNYSGTWYYLDLITGEKTTGIVKLPAMPTTRAAGSFYYEFNSVGVYQGPANGLFVSSDYVYDADKNEYVETTVKRIVKDGVIQTGVQTVDGNKYYVDPDSYSVVTNSSIYVDTDNDPSTPDELINLDQNGVVAEVFNTWAEVNGNKYYYDASGKLASGYTAIDGYYYYFDTTTHVMLKSGWATVYGTEMFFGKDGKAADGIVVDEALAAKGALDNTGYFVDGVPATTEVTDGQYKYIFINGMLDTKTAIGTNAPEILIWIIKDGIKNSFYFPVNADKSFEKTFSAYPCYKLEIYDVSTGTPVLLNVTDNKLVIEANSTSHTFEVRYTPVEHTYPETPNQTVQAGCATEGYKQYICELCGETYKETIPATGEHVYGEWNTVKDANCTQEGLKIRSCDCGAVESEIIPRNNVHKFSEYDTIQPATCTTAGYASGICERCGERMDDVVVIPALGHNYNGVTWETDKVANCVEKGTEKGLCTRGCGTTLYRETAIDPTNHKGGTITKQSEAGNSFVLFKTVKASTCQTAGSGIFRCLDCGGFIGDEDVPASLVTLDLDPTNHEWGDEYLVVFDENGDVIETVTGATRAEMIEKSKYLCGYSGAWRKDCTNPNCVLEDDTTRAFTTVELINGNGAHEIDLDNLYTTTDTKNPLVGMHYYKCTKCEKEIQATAHVMSDIKISTDNGLTHVIYCEGGCIIEGTTGTAYSVTEACDHNMMIIEGGEFGGHGDKCKCGHVENYVAHDNTNLTPDYDETEHWSECEVCGYQSEKLAHTIENVEEQVATCWQIGWAEHDKCMLCGYVEEYAVYNQYPHNISGDYISDGTGHWYGCQNYYEINDVMVKCTSYKHLYELHDMVHILASDPTCEKDGTVEHWECSVCGWYDETMYPDGVVRDKLDHDPAGAYNYDTNEHWQFCDRCGTIIRNDHTYNTVTNFIDYDDENGTANFKCDTCEYKKPLKDLETWYSVLGLNKEGSDYYLYVNGVKMKDYLAELPDGSYRYFDNDGKLVMAVFNNGQFDSITNFGPDGLTNLIGALTNPTYSGYTDTKAAERGAIKNAIIDTVDRIMMIENGKLVTGWKTITVNGEDRDYYFNSKLNGVLVNADFREGALVTSENLTIKAPSFVNSDVIMDIVNVRADGSLLLGVVPNGDGTASLYLDGTAGKMSEGWVADNYYNVGAIYYIFADKTLANGNYVETIGGIYWNFNAPDAENPYVRADEHCKNVYWDCGDEDATTNLWINAEGKKAENEIVTIGENGYYIVMDANGVQSLFTGDYDEVGGVYYTFEDGIATGLLTAWLPETVGETTVYNKYVLNGILQKSTFVDITEEVEGQSVTNKYYFDAAGNKIAGKIVYIKNADGTAKAWFFGTDGVATDADDKATKVWVNFIGENGLVDTEHMGYYFDAQRGLAYGVQDGSINPGEIYFFNQYGYVEVGVEKEYNGVVYWLDEITGKATIKTDDDDAE